MSPPKPRCCFTACGWRGRAMPSAGATSSREPCAEPVDRRRRSRGDPETADYVPPPVRAVTTTTTLSVSLPSPSLSPLSLFPPATGFSPCQSESSRLGRSGAEVVAMGGTLGLRGHPVEDPPDTFLSSPGPLFSLPPLPRS